MKNLFLIILTLTTALTAQASHYFHGFYLAGAAGGNIMNEQADRDLVASTPGQLALVFPADITLQGSSGASWLGAGYSHPFHSGFVLAGEFTAGISNPEVSHRNELMIAGNLVESKIESELKNDFSLVFKPGFIIKKNSQIYALVGARWGKVESTLTTDTLDVIVTDQESGYQLGYTLGLGLEHLITEKLTLGLEYAYTDYGDINSPKTLSYINNGMLIQINDNSDLSMSTNTLGARLSYFF